MTPRPTDLPESEFAPALRHAREGRFDEAMRAVAERLRVVTERESRLPAAANALAAVAALADEAGDRGAAERALDQAITLKPRYPDLHFRRACVLLRDGRRPEARRALDRAIEINPRYRAALLERAMLDAREGLVGEAIESLRELSTATPDDDRRSFQQGLRRLERADWEEADALLRRALHLDDASLERELVHARELLDCGRKVEAALLLRAIAPRFAGYADVHALLGRAEIACGAFDDAMLALGRALELNPDFHDARVLLAHALEGAGQRTQAQEQLALVLECDPAHAEALARSADWSRAGMARGRRG